VISRLRARWSALSAALLLLAAVLFATAMSADKIPPGYVVLRCTISPDGRFGVLVPKTEELEHLEMTYRPQNQVIDLATGNIIAVIRTNWVGATRHNHGGVLPTRWSKDDSLVLWQVDGKWFRDAVVLLKFSDGKLDWQADITRAAQAECLLRTRRAEPKLYARAMADNVRNGKAYPEGFSVQVSIIGDLRLPLQVRATLTSNPKALAELGMSPLLESTLLGFVDSEGRFQVTNFRVGRGLWKRYVGDAAESDDQPCRSDDVYVPTKDK
jgi:hypothetical protein